MQQDTLLSINDLFTSSVDVVNVHCVTCYVTADDFVHSLVAWANGSGKRFVSHLSAQSFGITRIVGHQWKVRCSCEYLLEYDTTRF